jgi:hypothetical protein
MHVLCMPKCGSLKVSECQFHCLFLVLLLKTKKWVIMHDNLFWQKFRKLVPSINYYTLLNNMIKTALIRLNQPVSYSSSAQLNIYIAFRPWANTALVSIGPGPKKLYRFRFAILLSFRHYVRILQFFMT